MATTRFTGATYGDRMGNGIVYHSFRVASNTSTAAIALPCVLQCSTNNPVVIEGSVLVTTADGGTTPTISLGISATATEIVNGASTATAATNGTFLPASNAVGKVVVTTDGTQLFYKQGGTPNGTGVIWLMVGIYELNSMPIA